MAAGRMHHASDPVSRARRPDPARVATYLTCLAALAFLLFVGIVGGGHG